MGEFNNILMHDIVLIKFKNMVKRRISPDGVLRSILKPAWHLLNKHVHLWETNFNAVELEITTFCNLACLNCDRSVRQAPTGELMSLEQVEKFVKESLDLNYKWGRIMILGGEPTLHPQFFEILNTIKKYKDKNPDCVVGLTTNGYGEKVRRIIDRTPDWVQITDTNKRSNKQNFSSYNIAPVDIIRYRKAVFSKGCAIMERCGLGLTRYGYFPCGAGASVARVFGFDIGIKKLSMVKSPVIKQQLNRLCCYCGHFKDAFEPESASVSEEVMSPAWQTAYQAYNIKKPELTLY